MEMEALNLGIGDHKQHRSYHVAWLLDSFLYASKQNIDKLGLGVKETLDGIKTIIIINNNTIIE